MNEITHQQIIENFLEYREYEYLSKENYITHVLFNDELEIEFFPICIKVSSVHGVFEDMKFQDAFEYIEWLISKVG